MAKSCGNRKEESGRADGSRELRMEEVMVDGKGGRCAPPRVRLLWSAVEVGGCRFYFRRRARTRDSRSYTSGEYESPFCKL